MGEDALAALSALRVDEGNKPRPRMCSGFSIGLYLEAKSENESVIFKNDAAAPHAEH